MRLLHILVTLACLVWGSGSLAQAIGQDGTPSLAGKIDLVSGEVTVVQSGNQTRRAAVGESVNEGDTLITGPSSELHMTMQDTGFIALRPNTKLKIEKYRADGGDSDTGVFRLLLGGMRSITGWIGKFNRRSYQVNTPTATVGIRGTDHETWYIAPGSSEGEPGTYDKVFFGATTIETNAGQTAVDANQAGFVSSGTRQMPAVLGRIPGFFRPGPHEDIINKKHAEIQEMIEQRREERRKVVAEKLGALNAARAELAQQQEKDRQAAMDRKSSYEQQHQIYEDTLLALRTRSEALQEKRKQLQELRKAVQETTADDIRKNLRLRNQIRNVFEVGKSIHGAYKEMVDARAALNESNKAASEEQKAQADAQRRHTEEQLDELHNRQNAVQEKQKAIEAMRAAMQTANFPANNLAEQHKAIRDATEEAGKEQAQIRDALYALFEKNSEAAEARMMAAQSRRHNTQQQLAVWNEKEEQLQEQQKRNQEELEAIQESSATDPVKKKSVSDLLVSVREMAAMVENDLREIQGMRKALVMKNMAAADERQRLDVEQLRANREKRREIYEKSTDLQNEREAMQSEIRALYEQEQKRYTAELKADRQLRDATPDLQEEPARSP